MAFNAIDYIYLNPELPAYSNILTIEDALNFHDTDSNGPSLVYDTSIIPSNLDPFVFLSTNKDIIPIAKLSQSVFDAMSNDNIPIAEIISTGRFVSSIVKDIRYTANNRFTLSNTSSYNFNVSNLNIGDEIRVFDDLKREYFFTVNNYSSSNIFIGSHKYILHISSNYILDGIKVFDPLRVAKTGLVRIGENALSNTSNILPESGTFNASLYRLLYPNASRLTDQEAYIDYISKRKNNQLRINNADEFLANYIATSNVEITGVNNIINRNLSFGQSNRLVTEYGIRQFTENLFDEIGNNANFSEVFITSNFSTTGPAQFESTVDISSNLRVLNSSILTGAVTMCNTLQVMRQAQFDSNVSINKNALVYGTLSVHGNMYNPRIGIGYYMDSNGSNNAGSNQQNILIASQGSNTYINGSNIGFGTDSPSEKVDIVGNMKVSKSVYAMSNVGIGLSNPLYQLHLSVDSAAKPTSSTWIVSSDKRLKENIHDADLDRCYDILKNLPLKRYTWNDFMINSKSTKDKRKLGWIAQDVETFFPKSVDKKDMYGISDCRTLDNDQLYATMYGCIQKLQHMVEHLTLENNKIKQYLNIY
jgi:hypothetical protein